MEKFVLVKYNVFLFNNPMKFSATTKDLLAGLQLVTRAIGTEQVLPILQNILIVASGKQCTLSATNLELSIITTLDVAIEHEGSITIPAKALLNFIQYNQDDSIVLETSEGTQLKLHSKRAKATILGDTAQGFPTIVGIQKETTLHLPIHHFVEALSLTTFSCAKTNARPVISGAYMFTKNTTLTIASTDSYRLSEYVITLPSTVASVSCIIPVRFLDELKSILLFHLGHHESTKEKGDHEASDQSFELHLSTQQIEARIGSTTIISRLIEGKFPDYQQVLPKERKATITVSTKNLLSAVKRMHYFAKEQSNNITFSFTRDAVNFITKQTQIGRDESSIPALLEGAETKIAVSSTYLIDFLSRLSSENVLIDISDKLHPAIFRLPENTQYFHLIMPLRLAEE